MKLILIYLLTAETDAIDNNYQQRSKICSGGRKTRKLLIHDLTSPHLYFGSQWLPFFCPPIITRFFRISETIVRQPAHRVNILPIVPESGYSPGSHSL